MSPQTGDLPCMILRIKVYAKSVAGINKTNPAVASFAPDKIAKTAIKNPKMVEPENPGKILAGCQLKIKRPMLAPQVIKASLARLAWVGSPAKVNFKESNPRKREATVVIDGICPSTPLDQLIIFITQTIQTRDINSENKKGKVMPNNSMGKFK